MKRSPSLGTRDFHSNFHSPVIGINHIFTGLPHLVSGVSRITLKCFLCLDFCCQRKKYTSVLTGPVAKKKLEDRPCIASFLLPGDTEYTTRPSTAHTEAQEGENPSGSAPSSPRSQWLSESLTSTLTLTPTPEGSSKIAFLLGACLPAPLLKFRENFRQCI